MKFHRFFPHLTLFTVAFAGGIPISANAAGDEWYTVELLVFANEKPDLSIDERWPKQPGLPALGNIQELMPIFKSGSAPPPTLPRGRYEQIWGADFEMNDVAAKLQNNPDYHVILHTGWRQAVIEDAPVKPVYIDDLVSKVIAPEDWMLSFDDPSVLGSKLPPDAEPVVPFPKGADHVDPTAELPPEAPASPTESVSPLSPSTRVPSISELRTGPPKIDVYGTVSLKRTRFLHLSVDLIYRGVKPEIASALRDSARKTTGSVGKDTTTANDDLAITFLNIDPGYVNGYRLQDSRKLKGASVFYFDHPLFGVIAKVSNYNPPTSSPTVSKTPPAKPKGR